MPFTYKKNKVIKVWNPKTNEVTKVRGAYVYDPKGKLKLPPGPSVWKKPKTQKP